MKNSTVVRVGPIQSLFYMRYKLKIDSFTKSAS